MLAPVRAILAERWKKTKQGLSTGSLRSWNEIIGSPSQPSDLTASSASDFKLTFSDSAAGVSTRAANVREYHGTYRQVGGVNAVFGLTSDDLDMDGLPEAFENQLADNFTPVFGVSTGEPNYFARFGDYVPQTVIQRQWPVPPISHFRVQPLGLATDRNGTLVYAMRIDYLTAWDGDSGLIGGGAWCLYSYFGLDSLVQTLTGHELDNERSGMLVAAPAVDGSYNPDPDAYNLYSVYLAAHEGTFFDHSIYADFWPTVPAGNHLNVALSKSKHATYNFNPDYYPLFPFWLIADTYAGLYDSYYAGLISYDTLLLSLAIADDVFYGCVVERFGYQGGAFAQTRINMGEPDAPINGCGFIRDNTPRSSYLYQKLVLPLW
ncbi:MAG: hypothetical protein LC126_24185 [Bryobacterales bacterium]|nr:hypothetical protein [Bryobacterales bacterium]